MIFRALKLIETELNDYFNRLGLVQSNPQPVTLNNISKLDFGGETDKKIDDTVIMSLVNLEEEKRLKNLPAHIQKGDETQYKNPPVNLNMYVLFSANHPNYETSLRHIASIIAFFQGKKYFNPSNSPAIQAINITPGIEGKLDLNAEIHTLNFEQINDLWGSLGGKQVPFVIYKMRLIGIERDLTLFTAPSIETVDGEGSVD